MPNLNKVLLMGNLTRDPQVRYTPSGTAVAEIGLAINRYWFDKQANTRREEVTFVDVTLWGRHAELAGEYLSKGRPLFVEGRLQLDTWDDKQTGQKRSKMRVVCENMEFLGSRGEGGGTGAGNRGAPRSTGAASEGPAPGGESQEVPEPNYSQVDPGPPPHDEVPF